MQVRVTAILALFLGVLGVTLGTPAAAQAAQPQTLPVTSAPASSAEDGQAIQGTPSDEASPGGASCVRPEPTDDETISILGLICDRRETPPAPVEGVRFTVLEDGEVVGEATSGANGTFVVDLPGSSIEVLGHTYVVQLDDSTLPEDTEPDQLEREITINLDTDQSVLFGVGAAEGAGSGIGIQAAQLLVGGMVFSVLLAMAALGLSLIFGTTGLTNFAHGELVTFGALAAFFVDQLPGAIQVGGVNITVAVGVVAAFVIGGAFGWLNDAALWHPLRRRGTGIIAMMIVSIGLSVFLRYLFQYYAGAQARNYSQYSAIRPWEVGPWCPSA